MFKHRVDHVVEVLKHDYMRARIGADTAERGPTPAKHFGTIRQLLPSEVHGGRGGRRLCG